MKAKRLTQAAVEKIKPAAKRETHWDAIVPGFGLRVTPNGKKSWIAVSRVRGTGRQVWITIGKFGVIPEVDRARKLARDALFQTSQGIDPTAERKRERAEKIAAATDPGFRTVSQIVEGDAKAVPLLPGYLNTHVAELRPVWAREVTRYFRKDILPTWGSRDIKGITKGDVQQLLDAANVRGKSAANHLLAVLKTFFAWAVEHDHIVVDKNPTAKLKPPNKTKSRDRVLTDEEIVAIWQACEQIGYPYGPLFQFALLTGQRRGQEIGEMVWAPREIDFEKRIWTIPSERAKNQKTHDVYLSDQAIAILKKLPRINGTKWVWTSNGEKPVGAWSAIKTKLDKMVPTEKPWTFHDLRRTTASGMAEMGVLPHVVDKLLNHTAGMIKGVALVYNRHDYASDRKAAFEAWGNRVDRLINPPADDRKVVNLRS